MYTSAEHIIKRICQIKKVAKPEHFDNVKVTADRGEVFVDFENDPYALGKLNDEELVMVFELIIRRVKY